jgi:hypothetical protein
MDWNLMVMLSKRMVFLSLLGCAWSANLTACGCARGAVFDGKAPGLLRDPHGPAWLMPNRIRKYRIDKTRIF